MVSMTNNKNYLSVIIRYSLLSRALTVVSLKCSTSISDILTISFVFPLIENLSFIKFSVSVD